MEYCALGDLTCLIKGNETSTSDHPILSRLFETYPSPNTRERGLHHAFTLNFLQQLASALKFLRSRNLVHRDIKPQNLLLSLPRFDCENSHVFHDAGYVGIYNFPILKVQIWVCTVPAKCFHGRYSVWFAIVHGTRDTVTVRNMMRKWICGPWVPFCSRCAAVGRRLGLLTI